MDTWFELEIIEFNSSTDAPVAYIAVQPEHRGAKLSHAGSETLTDDTEETIDSWTAVSDGDNIFDPGDTGPTQRFWLGSDQTFIDGDVDTTDDEIDNLTAHGFQTGEGPVTLTSSGTLPAGLATATKYWIIRIDANTIAFADDRADALAGTTHDITAAAGGGTHTIETAEKLVIPAGISRAKIFGGLVLSASATMLEAHTLIKEGVTPSAVQQMSSGDITDAGARVITQTGIVDVTEGEFYVLRGFQNSDGNETVETDSTFEIEVIEESRAITFPGVTVTPPFRGAIVRPAADETGADYTVDAVLSFDEEDFDSDGFHDNATNNSRLTIPTGLGITKVRVGAQLTTDLMATISALRFRVVSTPGNEAANIGLELDSGNVSTTDQTRLNLISPAIDVSDTDYFELFLRVLGDADFTIQHAATMFWIEVVETDENAFPPHQIDIFLDKAAYDTDAFPTTGGEPLFKMVAARRFTLADDFAGSVGHTEVVPTVGAATFDVNRNGSKIGEVSFALSASTATFTTTGGTAEVFDVGDRLEIDTISDYRTMDHIAISLFAWRS